MTQGSEKGCGEGTKIFWLMYLKRNCPTDRPPLPVINDSWLILKLTENRYKSRYLQTPSLNTKKGFPSFIFYRRNTLDSVGPAFFLGVIACCFHGTDFMEQTTSIQSHRFVMTLLKWYKVKSSRRWTAWTPVVALTKQGHNGFGSYSCDGITGISTLSDCDDVLLRLNAILNPQLFVFAHPSVAGGNIDWIWTTFENYPLFLLIRSLWVNIHRFMDTMFRRLPNQIWRTNIVV